MSDEFEQRHNNTSPRDKQMKSPTSNCIQPFAIVFNKMPDMFADDFRAFAFAYIWEGQNLRSMNDWDIAVQSYQLGKTATEE